MARKTRTRRQKSVFERQPAKRRDTGVVHLINRGGKGAHTNKRNKREKDKLRRELKSALSDSHKNSRADFLLWAA